MSLHIYHLSGSCFGLIVGLVLFTPIGNLLTQGSRIAPCFLLDKPWKPSPIPAVISLDLLEDDQSSGTTSNICLIQQMFGILLHVGAHQQDVARLRQMLSKSPLHSRQTCGLKYGDWHLLIACPKQQRGGGTFQAFLKRRAFPCEKEHFRFSPDIQASTHQPSLS